MITRTEAKMIAREIIAIMREEQPDNFLNTEQAAAFLGCSKSYIYHNIHKIPHTRKGGAIKFTKQKLTEFINK